MKTNRVEIDWKHSKIRVFTALYHTEFTYDMTEDFNLVEKEKAGMIKALF